MKVFVIFAIVLCLESFVGANDISKQWDEFKIQYRKVYKSREEEAKARDAFAKSVEEIKELSRERRGFQVGINSLADMEYSEFVSRNNYGNEPWNFEQYVRESTLVLNDDDPEEVDWSQNARRVGPVKDQGALGASWAFATTGLIESQEHHLLSLPKVVPLSEQQLIDCVVKYQYDKDTMLNAINYTTRAPGLESESDYPYRAGEGNSPCKFDKTKAVASTRRFGFPRHFRNYTEERLKGIVAVYGPVSAIIDASHMSFKHYKTGVYYEIDCLREYSDLNHAVLIVGYGHDEKYGDYWLVKNSWGTGWGMSGYFKLARNHDNHCGIVTNVNIVQ